MGVDYTIMVTSYVKCFKKMETESFPEFFCGNSRCKIHNKTFSGDMVNFCPACGIKLSLRNVEEEIESVDPYKMTQNGTFAYLDTNDDFDYYVPNKHKKNEPKLPPSIDVNREETGFHEIIPDSVSSHLEWFKKEFSKEIEKLEKAYGKQNVSVHFGIVNWVC